MDRAPESSTPNALPQRYVAKIFQEMQGNYGTRFLNQWKTGQVLEDGTDAGVINAMALWGKKLAGFIDQPERIRRVLDDLPPDPPSLPKFIELCRAAPANEKPSLPYKPSVDDIERQREMANSASAAVSVAKVKDGIDQHWATHPRSHAHLRAIFSAANSDRRFLPCVQKMVDDGICSADGQAIRFYRGAGEWIGA